jgi:hypothetical protein
MRLEAYSLDDGSPDFEAYFFEMLSLDATREMLLGKPGTARVAKAGEHISFAFEGEDITYLAEFLSRGVASDERAFRRAALAAIRHGLGVSEETGAWRFDESPWCEFAALVDALEDFAAHLVDAAWKHIDALHPRGAADLSSRARGIPYHFVISAWTRGLRHANPTVRSKTLETFHRREWGASRPDADLMRSLDLPAGERFATDTLIRAAMETPNGDEKVKDFLRAYVGGCDSRDTREAMRRVTAVVATVSRCAATANTRGLDVGTSIVEHAARAYESACGDAWHYTHEAQISRVLNTLGDCAVQLLSVARKRRPGDARESRESRVRRRADPRTVRLHGSVLFSGGNGGAPQVLLFCPATFTGRAERGRRRRRARVDARARGSRRVAESGFGSERRVF